MRSPSSSPRKSVLSGTAKPRRWRRLAIPMRAALVVAIGALPAIFIASSARAAGATAADDWTMGVLALAFGSMLLLLSMLARHMVQGLKDGAERGKRHDRGFY
jgi:hypothetical protein